MSGVQSGSSNTGSAISGSMKIIQMLCDYPGIFVYYICLYLISCGLIFSLLDTNCALTNKRGFNALQHAALKGNGFACSSICRRFPDLVDRRKDDGFSALHLAALNGHVEAVNALVNTF